MKGLRNGVTAFLPRPIWQSITVWLINLSVKWINFKLKSVCFQRCPLHALPVAVVVSFNGPSARQGQLNGTIVRTEVAYMGMLWNEKGDWSKAIIYVGCMSRIVKHTSLLAKKLMLTEVFQRNKRDHAPILGHTHIYIQKVETFFN